MSTQNNDNHTIEKFLSFLEERGQLLVTEEPRNDVDFRVTTETEIRLLMDEFLGNMGIVLNDGKLAN